MDKNTLRPEDLKTIYATDDRLGNFIKLLPKVENVGDELAGLNKKTGKSFASLAEAYSYVRERGKEYYETLSLHRYIDDSFEKVVSATDPFRFMESLARNTDNRLNMLYIGRTVFSQFGVDYDSWERGMLALSAKYGLMFENLSDTTMLYSLCESDPMADVPVDSECQNLDGTPLTLRDAVSELAVTDGDMGYDAPTLPLFCSLAMMVLTMQVIDHNMDAIASGKEPFPDIVSILPLI